MKRKLKFRIPVLCMLLTVMLCATVIPASAASSLDKSGTCGENLTWELTYGNSYPLSATLTIRGTGSMYDYGGGKDTKAPWNVGFWGGNYDIKTLKIEYGVTSIGACAFYDLTGLSSIILPDSVKIVGNWAFGNCDNVTKLDLGECVSFIGEHAFDGCEALGAVEIPASTVQIGTDAFNGVDVYRVHADNHFFSAIDGVLYSADQKTLYHFPVARSYDNEEQRYVIPEGVTAIGNRAFYGSELKSVYFPQTLTTIGEYAFAKNTLLGSVILPDSVTVLGKAAFSDCDSLMFLDLGQGVTEIGSCAFEGCNALPALVIPDSVRTIGELAFAYTGIATLVLENGAVAIGTEAFRDCDSLTSLNLGQGVVSIGDEAFYDCDAIPAVVIPDSVRSIGEYAFRSCNAVRTIDLGSGVTTIGAEAFYYCCFDKLCIPTSVTSIGQEAFTYLLGEVWYMGSPRQWADVELGPRSYVMNRVKFDYADPNWSVSSEDAGVMTGAGVVEEINEGKSVEVEIPENETTATATNMIAAIFDRNGRMIDLVLIPVEYHDGVFSTPVSFAQYGDAAVLRLILTDSGFVPLVDNRNFKK